MKKQMGISLIELMVVTAIIGIGVSFFVDISSTNTSFGINGVVETRCVEGYKTVVGQRGLVTQMIDEKGHAIPCKYSNPQ